jgi:glycosyltransferase involved in cell wall biosynthesis
MGMGKAILFKDSPATREVLGDAGEAFDPADPVAALAEKIALLAGSPDRCASLGLLALARAADTFSWDVVLEKYRRLFDDLLPAKN